MLTDWDERELTMKRFAFVSLLLATIFVCAGCEKRIIVPVGTTLYRPVIEDNACVFLNGDYYSETTDETSYSSTQSTHTGVLSKVIDCPYKREPEPVQFALVKSEQNRFLWVMLSDLKDG